MTDAYDHLDAAYVLDALDAEERAAYEQHLSTCADCRAAVEEGRRTLLLLGGSDESVLDDVAPLPDTLLPAMLAQAGRSRRRRTVTTAAAAALVAACVITVAAVVATRDRGATEPVARPMVALRSSPVSATAALSPTGWGTRVDVVCWYADGASAPAGYRYGLTVRSTSGAITTVGSWRLDDGDRIRFTTGTALPPDQIAAVDITDPGGSPILELRPGDEVGD